MFRLPWSYQHWHLQIRLLPCLVTLLLLVIFVQLGCWQLRRAAEKETLVLNIQQRKTSLSLQAILEKPASERRYQAIQLQGYFLGSIQILLDNQMQGKKPGYRIFSLFYPENHDKYLLIDRGWIPLGEDRRNFPNSAVLSTLPKTSIQIQGRLDDPSSGFLLKGSDLLEPMGNFLRVQSINVSLISNFFKKPLYPFIVRLEALSPYAFAGTEPQISMPATKHLGYALQWFTMAFVTLVYFGIISLKRNQHGSTHK